MEYDDQESGYFDAVDLFKRDNETDLVRATQGIFGLKRKLLSAYLYDCQELVSKINSRDIRDPAEAVNFYNRWKASIEHDGSRDLVK